MKGGQKDRASFTCRAGVRPVGHLLDQVDVLVPDSCTNTPQGLASGFVLWGPENNHFCNNTLAHTLQNSLRRGGRTTAVGFVWVGTEGAGQLVLCGQRSLFGF